MDLFEEDVGGALADGAEGCEIEFCPVMTVPSFKPAEMWCEKLLLMAGMTFTLLETPVIAPSK